MNEISIFFIETFTLLNPFFIHSPNKHVEYIRFQVYNSYFDQ